MLPVDVVSFVTENELILVDTNLWSVLSYEYHVHCNRHDGNDDKESGQGNLGQHFGHRFVFRQRTLWELRPVRRMKKSIDLYVR